MTLYLIFHFCKMEKMIVSTLEGCEKQIMNEKCLIQGLEQRKCLTNMSFTFLFLFLLSLWPTSL